MLATWQRSTSARVEELPPGTVKIVRAGPLAIGVYNCGGELVAIEDRCSHDDGPLCEGDWEPDDVHRRLPPPRLAASTSVSGRALTLPAYQPVDIFPVSVRDGVVVVDLPTDRSGCVALRPVG